MTNFDYIKNMDIVTLACFIVNIKKRTAEDTAKILGVKGIISADAYERSIAKIIEELAAERDTNV